MAKSRKSGGEGWSLINGGQSQFQATKVISLPASEQRPKVSLEKRQKGKLMTIVANLVLSSQDMKALAKKLKNHCGTGGSVKEGCIELQGDATEKVKLWLSDKGWSN